MTQLKADIVLLLQMRRASFDKLRMRKHLDWHLVDATKKSASS